MIPRYRAWFGSEMYDKPVVYDGEFFLDWRDFENWKTYDGAVLMQSTGLFDKNGKEIFEGDVVKFNDIWSEYDYEGYVDGASEGENFTEIIKTEDGFSFGRTKIPESSVFYFLDDEHMKFSEIVKSDDFSMVVIGNIYENPELLEATND
ncbi:YopX family protein [Streptococcus suis]